jgi:uncharacterized protein
MTYFGANLRGASEPIVIVALHLPDLSVARGASLAFLEDYVLANMKVFAATGVSSVMLQDQTREVGPASASTIAIMGASGRLARRKFPRIDLGIIVQAHDAEAPLAIAHAVGATFWLKVFVGSVMSMEGPRNGLAVAARRYRHALRRGDIAILAGLRSHQRANHIGGAGRSSQGGRKLSADGLVITGGSFADSLGRVRRAKAAGVRRPILIGGVAMPFSAWQTSIATTAGDGSLLSFGAKARKPITHGCYEDNLLRLCHALFV